MLTLLLTLTLRMTQWNVQHNIFQNDTTPLNPPAEGRGYVFI